MKVTIELFGASRDFSNQDSIEIDIENNSTIKDVRDKMLGYLHSNFKGNENFIKIVNSSVFCSKDNIISDNYKITNHEKIAIIPPIGGGLMLHTRVVDIKDKKLSIIDAEKFISSSDFGASIFFSGTVRNQNNDKSVTGITYDSHDALVIKSFKEIYNEADQKLKIKDKAVFIEHAKGFLNLGEISIIIAVACKHRDEAYVLSRYIIEEIKKRSPIWKKEHYQNNETDWLKGNPIQYEKN
ncbi:molybdenum cofactor biosynthesis protein MoaE [Candidatus Pelagibacter sp.]|nr:molybdenum cofactor biosynthesis protein MoaE [Candidatus Pelagibacter sp.]